MFPPSLSRQDVASAAGRGVVDVYKVAFVVRSKAAAVPLSPFLQADIAAKVKVVEAAAAGVCGLCSYAPLPASCPAAAEVAVVARRL